MAERDSVLKNKIPLDIKSVELYNKNKLGGKHEKVKNVLERMGYHKRRNENRFCNALCVVNSIPSQIHCFIYHGNLGVDKQNLM